MLSILSSLKYKMSCLATFTGTFITEWTDGATTCEAFLKDEESYRAVADNLVKISHFYGFDGWLINIENNLSVSDTFILAITTLALIAYTDILSLESSCNVGRTVR